MKERRSGLDRRITISKTIIEKIDTKPNTDKFDFLFISTCDDISTQHNCGILKYLFELLGLVSKIVTNIDEEDVLNARFIILYKTNYSDDIKNLVRKCNKRIGFIIDDHIFGNEKIENISYEFQNNIKKTIKEVDYCFCFDKILEKKLKELNKNTFLLSTLILWNGLFEKYNVPLPVSHNNQTIRIGLLSQSFYNNSLNDEIRDAVESSGNNNIEIIYFSDKEISIQVPNNVKLERHNFTYSFKEYYIKLFNLRLDLYYNILPENNILTLYKNSLKFRESAYLKIPLVIVDPTGEIFKDYIMNHSNGYSIKNRKEAVEILKQLVNNKQLRETIGRNSNIYYRDKQPFNIANSIYNEFIKNLEKFKISTTYKKMRVLAVAEGAIPSTELMLINPLTYLKNKDLLEFDIIYAGHVIKNNIKIDFNNYDVVVMLRLCSIEAFDLLLNNPKQQCKHLKFIYMVDDDFSTLNNNTPVGVQYKRINTALELFIKNSDIVMVSSKNLFKSYNKLNSKIFLMTSFHDISKIDKMKQYTTKDNTIVIGYAAGSHHYENFKILISPLKQILQKYKNVRFECYFNGRIQGLEGLNVISHSAINGLDNFYKHILSRNWDIGLAPLQFNEFNKSKSDNKYREYASFEIAGIYSDIECYDMIKNKETGILCKTESDWFNAMEKLITDINKRNRIVKNAYEDVKQTYNIDKVAEDYMKIFRGEL